MSLNYTQIIRQLEKELGFEKDAIALNAQRKQDFTEDINLAIDDVTAEILPASGTWKYDDPNHTKYPIIQTNLVSGQRDYTFTTDEQGYLILDIYKVLIADPDGVFKQIEPVDAEETDSANTGFFDGKNTTGTPDKYDKMANGLFLDPIPNYSVTNGIKVYYDRESTHFTTSDTTKMPGFDGLYHEYCVLAPAYRYARTNNLANVERLKRDLEEMKLAIKKRYAYRSRDEWKGMRPLKEDNH